MSSYGIFNSKTLYIYIKIFSTLDFVLFKLLVSLATISFYIKIKPILLVSSVKSAFLFMLISFMIVLMLIAKQLNILLPIVAYRKGYIDRGNFSRIETDSLWYWFYGFNFEVPSLHLNHEVVLFLISFHSDIALGSLSQDFMETHINA